MARSATLAIRIVSDASQAGRGFADAEAQVGGFQRNLDRATVAATGTLVAVGGLAKQAFDSASALQQSGGAVESVFAGQAAAIQDLAKNAAQAVGLSTNSYQELAAVLGSQLRGMGYAGRESVETTDDLIRTGADLAATFGGTTADAVSALSSLLRGERDPIERYGIAMSQASVDAQVLAMGLDTSTPAAERAANAQATLALVAQQSAAAQGAFAREADTAAGQTQRATAEWENASAALGEALLPLVAEGAQELAGLAGFMARNSEVVVPLVGAIAAMAVALIAVNAAMRAYAVVQAIVNAVMAASPIVWIAVVILGIVAAVVILYQKFEAVRNILDAVGRGISRVFGWVGDLFSSPAQVDVAHSAVAGTFGAPAGGGGFAPVRSAAMSAGVGGGGMGSSVGSGPGQAPSVSVVIQGALDPVSVGRQVDRVLRRYGAASGSRSTARGGLG